MYDIIIVGSGPAGAVAAYETREKEMNVLLLDKTNFPRYKPCGGGFGSKIFDVISEEEIKDLPSAVQNKGLHIISPSLKHEAKMQRAGLRSYMISRIDFDNYLHKKALAAGVEFKQEKVLDAGYTDDKKAIQVKTKNGYYMGKLLVIANGVYSKLPAKFGLPNPYSRKAVGLTLNSESEMNEEKLNDIFGKDHHITIFFGIVKRGYGWVFPHKNRLNIGVGCTMKYFKHTRKVYEKFIETVKEYFNIDELKLEKPRGYIVPFYKPIKQSYSDNVLVTGDAGYLVSALTAEGICYAVKSGQFAAKAALEAIQAKDYSAKFLKRYQQYWLNDFGYDLIKYSVLLQKIMYKNDFRMETIVKLAEKDDKLMAILTDTIMGAITYKQAFRKIIARIGISLFKKKKV